jgi:replicative DNA helicase
VRDPVPVGLRARRFPFGGDLLQSVPPTPPPGGGGSGPPPPPLLALSDLLLPLRASAEAAHRAYRRGIPQGPVTGLATLDAYLGKVLRLGTHVLQAGPGSGKTALASQVAAGCGCPAVYVSCEMSPVELLLRHTARETGTFLDTLKHGSLDADAVVALAETAIAKLSQLYLVDAIQTYLTPGQLLRYAEAARGPAPHVLVVVDSIHSWAERAVLPWTEYENLNAHLAKLRQIAGQLGCAVLGVAERNRAAMSAGGLSASAGSRKFEYGAETVLGITADTSPGAGPLPAGQKALVVSIEKNRHGSAGGTVAVVFNGALMRFAQRVTGP